jgi:DnaD/phage-associated family protein
MTNAPSFAGFSDAALAVTIPATFFAQVMPQIDRREELVVSAYFFYAVSQSDRKRRPRYVTRRELAADGALLRSLASVCGGEDHEALDSGLRLAVQRRTLVRAVAESDRGGEDLYAVNTPSNRRALEALAGAAVDAGEPLPPAAGVSAPNIFALYEQNIGTITPLIAEELQEAETRFPAAWVEAAFREAVENNKRSWRYVERILRRWEAEGPDYEESEGDHRIEWLERRYREGKRRQKART